MALRILVLTLVVVAVGLAQDKSHLDSAYVSSLKSLSKLQSTAAIYDVRGDEKNLEKIEGKIDAWLRDKKNRVGLIAATPAQEGWHVAFLGAGKSPYNVEGKHVARFLFLYSGKDPASLAKLNWSAVTTRGKTLFRIEDFGIRGENATAPVIQTFPVRSIPAKQRKPLALSTEALSVTSPEDWEVVSASFSPRSFRPKTLPEQLQVRQIAVGKNVQAACDWLRRHQSADGSWEGDAFMGNGDPKLGPLCDGKGVATYDCALTGLALLALLEADQGVRAGKWRPEVRKGLKWLLTHQAEDGTFGSGKLLKNNYNHAIATVAVAEAYRVGHSPRLEEPLRRAVKYCLKAQNPNMGWRYGAATGKNGVSTTAFMVTALNRARRAGINVPNRSFAWAMNFIAQMTDEEVGRIGNYGRGMLTTRHGNKLEQFPPTAVECTTAAGLSTLAACSPENRKNRLYRTGLELLMKKLPRWDSSAGSIDMLYWFWGSRAVRSAEKTVQDSWDLSIQAATEKTQRRDGNYAGSYEPIGAWGDVGGRVYSTAMMALAMIPQIR